MPANQPGFTPQLWVAIVAAAIALAGIVLTYFVARENKRLAMLPVLTFTKADDGWMITNVGQGPAMNIDFIKGEFESLDAPTTLRHHIWLLPIARGESLLMTFNSFGKGDQFGVTYSDATDTHRYSSQMVGFIFEFRNSPAPLWKTFAADVRKINRTYEDDYKGGIIRLSAKK